MQAFYSSPDHIHDDILVGGAHLAYTTNQPTNQPTNHPTNQPTTQPTNQPINQPNKQYNIIIFNNKQ